MFINRIDVKGKLIFTRSFGKKNIILGENNTGKSTLFKLLIYALGTKVTDFIDEIAKERLCQQVELDVTCKSGNMFRFIRKLPMSDNIIVIPIVKDGTLLEEDMYIYTTDEFSDFVLNQESYESQEISYGNNKKASLRFYFLLRAIVVDQDTPAYKIMADLGGNDYSYINSQNLIKKAIVEAILGKDNELAQRLRLELRNVIEERRKTSNKINAIDEIINRAIQEDSALKTNIEKNNMLLEEIEKQKFELTKQSTEQYIKLENISNAKLNGEFVGIRKDQSELRKRFNSLVLEKTDIDDVIVSIKSELAKLKKRISARQILTQIPVEHCPVCLSRISLEGSKEGECPYCDNKNVSNDIEKVLSFKKLLDESLMEAITESQKLDEELKEISERIQDADKKFIEVKKMYFDSLEDQRHPIKDTLNALTEELEVLSDKEQRIKSFVRSLSVKRELKDDYIKYDTKVKSLTEELEELEKIADSEDENKLNDWNDSLFDMLKFIYSDVYSTKIDEQDYMPLVNGTKLSNISGASLKVATRLAYILSLFKLSKDDYIAHPGFVYFDSPKDKDLDYGKYKRFIDLIDSIDNGQVFLSASISEKQLYNPKDIIAELYESKKLLQESSS